jgi:hypothetical protein
MKHHHACRGKRPALCDVWNVSLTKLSSHHCINICPSPDP